MVEGQLAGREAASAILAAIFVSCEDIAAVKFDIILRQPVVEEQPNNPRHGDVKIHSRNPVVAIRLELPAELAYLAPALEIVVGISAFLERDDLGKLATQKGEGASGADDADGHIVLVKDKHIAVQSGLMLASKHI